MHKLFLIFLSFLTGIFLSFILYTDAFAKKGKNNSTGSETLSVVNNKGEKVLNGSILDPSEDQLFVLLHSVLVSTLRGDLNNVSIVLSSIADPSKKFIVPKNAVSIQNKKINKKNGKYLSVNLFNIKTPSGITIPPSALQKDNYKLRIVNNKNMLDVSTDTFNYQTPVLIVGMANNTNSGFVVVEDLLGNSISNNVVALNANGSFFTEVKADMIKSLSRPSLKNQVTENDVYAGVIHVVSDKDLYAITPLENDSDINSAQADAPLIVNESTTLTANLAKEDESLALEVAKKELEDLQSPNNNAVNFGDLNCDVNQFANQCSTNDETALASLGEDVKQLISSPQCNLPDFVASIVLSSKDSDVSMGYCEFVNRKEDTSRICSNYSKILNAFKTSRLKQLPCPPSSCTDFQNIKPPKCVITKGFCESSSLNQGCISKPVRDLFCLKVPDEIQESDCANGSTSQADVQPDWVTAVSSLGNEYCVPSNPSVLSEIQIFSNGTSSPEDIAEECEYDFCYRQCDKQSEQDPANCYLSCDEMSGKIIDCTDVNSPYFSIKCCNYVKSSRIAKVLNSAYQFASSIFPSSSIADCLCADINNFNETTGYVLDESKVLCDVCPPGYKKDEHSGTCLAVCPEGFVRDQDGFCKKGCPSSLPYLNGKSCTAVCPDPLIPQQSSGGLLACLCSDGSNPDSNGKCLSSSSSGSSTTSISTATCAIGQVSTSTNSCTCASGAVRGSDGTCQCSNGQAYAAAGCPI